MGERGGSAARLPSPFPSFPSHQAGPDLDPTQPPTSPSSGTVGKRTNAFGHWSCVREATTLDKIKTGDLDHHIRIIIFTRPPLVHLPAGCYHSFSFLFLFLLSNYSWNRCPFWFFWFFFSRTFSLVTPRRSGRSVALGSLQERYERWF